MNHLPEIGARVAFRSNLHPMNTCIGTVAAIYPGSRMDDPDADDSTIAQVRVGEDGWTECWKALVEVDAPLPDWWPYAGDNRFCPNINELELAK